VSLGVVLGALFAVGWLPLFLFRAEAMSEALPYYGGVERACVQLTPLLLAAHMTLACVSLNRTPAVSQWRATLAVLVFAGAIAFWFWGRLEIGPLRIRRLPDEPPRVFRCDGAFGVVRHPLYFAYAVATAAPLCALPGPLLLCTWSLCLVALGVRARQEERRLHAQLGRRYAAYCREVRRLVPFVW
jgi:protein-S-isoprenylcysteine O-methyltransferase Ste14